MVWIMDDHLKQEKLAEGESGFTVPLGNLEILSKTELTSRYEKLTRAINAFCSIWYILSAGETLSMLPKLKSLKKRREYYALEMERRRSIDGLPEDDF